MKLALKPILISLISIQVQGETTTSRAPDAVQAQQLQLETNRFWKHIEDQQAGLLDDDGIDHFETMKRCVDTALRRVKKHGHSDTAPSPYVVQTLTDSKNHTVLVEIGNAITPEKAQSVEKLAACAKKYFPDTRYVHREFDAGGGNDCTFLNVLLQLYLPEVYKNVMMIAEMAYETAAWGGEHHNLRPPRTCGVRTSELLNYDEFKGLGGHDDIGSIFTILFTLSDSKLYEGGEFYIGPRPYNEEDGWYERLYYFKPRQYSAIIFLSRMYHGVTSLTGGKREMFANELWMYGDAPAFEFRPSNSAMHFFTQRVDENANNEMVDLRQFWPKEGEVEGETTYGICTAVDVV